MNQNEFYAHRQREKEREKIRLSQWVNKPSEYEISEHADELRPTNTVVKGIRPGPELNLDDLDDPDDSLELDDNTTKPNTETSNNPTVEMSVLTRHAPLIHTLMRHLLDIHDKILPHGDNAGILQVIHDPRYQNQNLTKKLEEQTYPYSRIRDNISTSRKLVNTLADSFGIFLQHHIDSENPTQPKIHDDLLQDYPEKSIHSEINGSPNLESVHPLVKHHIRNLREYLNSLLRAKNPEDINFEEYLRQSNSPDVTGLLSSLLKGEK